MELLENRHEACLGPFAGCGFLDVHVFEREVDADRSPNDTLQFVVRNAGFLGVEHPRQITNIKAL